MKVVFLLAAEVDIQCAYNLLEDFSEGFGDRFIASLEEAVEQIARFPLSCRLVVEDYRRLLLPRFPYGLFYVVESGRIVVHAVMDLRQNPETIRHRLLGKS